jgi:hypothetical protein
MASWGVERPGSDPVTTVLILTMQRAPIWRSFSWKTENCLAVRKNEYPKTDYDGRESSESWPIASKAPEFNRGIVGWM